MIQAGTPVERPQPILRSGSNRPPISSGEEPYITPSMGDNNTNRTPEEQRMIDTVAEREEREYAEEHSTLILLDARRVGLIE